MSYTDLRDFLKAAEARSELKCVNGAGWDLEMSSIAELTYREGKEPKPILLFDNVPGYPKGYRALFGLLSSPWRIAKTLGLPEDKTDRMSVVRNWRSKAKDLRLIPPEFVSSGPILENTDTGDKVDLLKFPVPRFHELDTKRFIGTCHGVIQRDPETGYVNIGTYRNMVADRNHLGLHATPDHHGNIIMQKYWARGETMPIAIATGLDPLIWWLTSQPATPWGVSEYDVAGGIKGKPFKVIKGPYTGLPIPAYGEIAIEGECRPGEFVDEGPFGEWHGYYGNRGLLTVPEPVIRVKAIHYRNNPILSCAHPTVPPQESSLHTCVAASEGIWSRLEFFGIPGIKGVWCHEVGHSRLFNVISLEQLYPGHAKQVGLIASQYPQEMGKYTIVVEDDIDPTDLEQVIWAVVTRSLPDRSIQILNHCRSSNVDTAVPVSEKRSGEKAKPVTSSRVVIDACRDLAWKEDWYPIARVSPELRAQISQKWQSLLSELSK